jgi:predicted MFS family arabinose efflux permease
MIDWWNLLTHGLWILGLAGALAVLSHSDWVASQQPNSKALTRALRNPLFSIGLALTCLGAGLGAHPGWERVAWFLLAIGFALTTGVLYRKTKTPPT